jgi:hypothetical protein
VKRNHVESLIDEIEKRVQVQGVHL